MADDKATEPKNPFEGAHFDISAVNSLNGKANQTLPNINGLSVVVPYTQPQTWTPLGNWDAANAGIEKTAGGINSFKYMGGIERLSGGLGLANDSIAVSQHLLAGRIDAASVEFVGVGGQAAGAASGYQIGRGLISIVANFVGVSNGVSLGIKFSFSSVGAYVGSNTSKSAAEAAFNELDRTPALAAGEAVKQVATLDGKRYGLGLSVSRSIRTICSLLNRPCFIPVSPCRRDHWQQRRRTSRASRPMDLRALMWTATASAR